MREQPRLYTVQQVAHILGVDEVSVRRWIRQGRIACVQLTRLRRVPAEELQRVLAEGLPGKPLGHRQRSGGADPQPAPA